MSGARRIYLHASRALFDLPPDRRPAALEALEALAAWDSDRLPGAVTIGAEYRLPGGADDFGDGCVHDG